MIGRGSGRVQSMGRPPPDTRRAGHRRAGLDRHLAYHARLPGAPEDRMRTPCRRLLAVILTVIVPTALTITALSYASYTAIGAWVGRQAMAAVLNVWFRRVMAACFIVYGALLGASGIQGRV